MKYPTTPKIGIVAATGGVAMDMMIMEHIVNNISKETFNQATGRCKSTSKISWENLLVIDPMSYKMYSLAC